MSKIRLPSIRYLSWKDSGCSATRDSLAFCARFLLAACKAATLFALAATICSFTNFPLCLSRVDMFWFCTLIFHLILYTDSHNRNKLLVINWRTLTVAPAATTWVGLGQSLAYRCNCSASVNEWWERLQRPSERFGSGHGYLQAEPELFGFRTLDWRERNKDDMSNCLSFSHTKQETRTYIISLGCRLDAQRCNGHFCGRYMAVVCIREHSLCECGCRTLLYASKSFDAPLRHHRATRGIHVGRTFGWDCFKTNTIRKVLRMSK